MRSYIKDVSNFFRGSNFVYKSHAYMQIRRNFSVGIKFPNFGTPFIHDPSNITPPPPVSQLTEFGFTKETLISHSFFTANYQSIDAYYR